MRRPWLVGLLLLVSLAGLFFLACPASPGGSLPLPPDQDWYPADVAPPPGTQYPCALTALPRDLPGIPAGERLYINHVYSMILRATRAKLVLQKALAEGGPALTAAHAEYRRSSGDALAKIRSERAPSGLQEFGEDVATAIELQRMAFNRAVRARDGGEPAGQEYKAPEARAASQKLMAAWSEMTQRYPALTPAMQDSTYHHLCALDFF